MMKKTGLLVLFLITVILLSSQALQARGVHKNYESLNPWFHSEAVPSIKSIKTSLRNTSISSPDLSGGYATQKLSPIT